MARKKVDFETPKRESRTLEAPKQTQVSIRVTKGLLFRAEDLVSAVQAAPPPGATRVTKSLVLRLALERGLAAMENEYGVNVDGAGEPAGGE